MNPLASAAQPGDLDALYPLRVAAEQWLATQGIDQWRAGEGTLPTIGDQLARGEWHVLRDGSEVVAALRLIWSEPLIWQSHDRFSAYIHGLVVARDHAGQAIGASLLDWAEEQARLAGAPGVRLDCAATNPRLRQYYTDLGFVEVDERTFSKSQHKVILLERPLH